MFLSRKFVQVSNLIFIFYETCIKDYVKVEISFMLIPSNYRKRRLQIYLQVKQIKDIGYPITIKIGNLIVLDFQLLEIFHIMFIVM